MVKKLIKIKEKVLRKFEKASDIEARDMVIKWHGWEYLSEQFIDSINNYDPEDGECLDILEDLLK